MLKRAAGLILLLLLAQTSAAELPVFEFINAKSIDEWKGVHDIAELKATEEGLLIVSSGNDPFIIGPARDFPADQLLSLRIRIKSEEGGELQVFYFKKGAREEDSIKTDIAPGVWENVNLLLPALGKGYRLRIDPPGRKGKTILGRIAFEARREILPPAWEIPVAPILQDPIEIIGDELTLRHSRTRLNEFELIVARERMGISGGWGKIGYVIDGKQRWFEFKDAKLEAHPVHRGLINHARIGDPDGGNWRIDQTFELKKPRGIDVSVTVWCDRDREVIFLPMLFVFAGMDTFGAGKTAAIFPGLEYLDENEPSGSEKDIEGKAARRSVPYTSKITVPLMSVLHKGKYVGLSWGAKDAIAAVFDSPDRIFKSGGHVMGLFYPGARARVREENKFMPIQPVKLMATQPVTLDATLIGGRATDVAEQVNDWIIRNDLPQLPSAGSLKDYVRLASAGWLDSKIGNDGKFRHAYPGGFGSHPAGDATAMLAWLAARSEDPILSARLVKAREAAQRQLKPDDVYASVGHIRTPVPALLYGDPLEAAARAARQGQDLLQRFQTDGTVLYANPGPGDMAKTHFAHHANGMTAGVVAQLLETAALSGDKELLKAGVERLRQLSQYADTAPRGAQTWEIPLHTPDILAAAHLVRAYTLGYQLSGDEIFLVMARKWAQTGAAFVYLRDPSYGGIGPFATIAVLGATNWKAPNWMGQPVQWCGLAYADALYRLTPFIAPGQERNQWLKIADGITASGIQQCWPAGSDPERQGLLPDSFKPLSQQRVDVCINPATLQVPAARFYRQPPLYEFYVVKDLFLHVPGEVIKTEDAKDALWLKVRPCVKGEYSILVSNLKKQPRVTINAAPPEKDAVKFVKEGRVVIKLRGESAVLLEDL